MKNLRRLFTSLVLGLSMFLGAGAVQPAAAAETAPVAAAIAQTDQEVTIEIDVIDIYVIDFDAGTIEYVGTVVIVTVTVTAA